MLVTLIAISGILIILSLLPFIQNQHWFFRAPEFLKVQLLVLQIAVFPIVFYYVESNPWLWYLQAIQFALICYHVYLLIRYSKLWRLRKASVSDHASDPIKLVSCNIYQFNTEYDRFIQLIKSEQPDLFITMESNSEWEQALRMLEKDYPNYEKVTLENTYGMHFYTKLKIVNSRVHYFVADDVPSIEAELETKDGYRFVFFGVHPPPPSPTEEENSKERDGDLLSVAKQVRHYKLPVLVTGDFNNVAWAKSSILFRKTSHLIDARIGRGLLSTFHAKYWFFRMPLDLLFHSSDIFIDQLLIYPAVGSDHFPVGCTFHVDRSSDEQEDLVDSRDQSEKQEVEELIKEGIEEETDNR